MATPITDVAPTRQGEVGPLVAARPTRYDLHIDGRVVGTIQEHDVPGGEDETVLSHWVLEISTWDQRVIRVRFAREDQAHQHAEGLLKVQMAMIEAVDRARRTGMDFSVTDQ